MIDSYPDLVGDLWDLFRVDVRDVLAGRCSVGWVDQFVERCFRHPFSVVRAKNFGGESWHEWYGWTHEAVKVAELSNLFLSANTPADKPTQRVWTPTIATTSAPATLDDAFAALSRLNAQ